MILNELSTPSPDIPLLLWTGRHVATAMGMTVKRVQALARAGTLPGFKVGRDWLFDPDAIRTWIKKSGVEKFPCLPAPKEQASRE